LGDDGAKWIADLIRTNTSIHTIDLSNSLTAGQSEEEEEEEDM